MAFSLGRVGVCWPAGVRWAPHWITTPDRCAFGSGWPGADPDNPRYQRDVWVSAYTVADVLESVGDAAAIDYWSKTHQVLDAS
ncbi:MAG TPA: hypothetical protein VF328_10195 [Mycobacterium sp.]